MKATAVLNASMLPCIDFETVCYGGYNVFVSRVKKIDSTAWLPIHRVILVFSFELFYIVLSGPFIADYAVWALVIVEGRTVT